MTSTLKGPVQCRESFLVVSTLSRSLSDSGDGIVDPNSSTRCIFQVAEECVGEGGIAVVDTSDSQGVLFPHKFVPALLTLTGEVSVGELVAGKALMSTTV